MLDSYAKLDHGHLLESHVSHRSVSWKLHVLKVFIPTEKWTTNELWCTLCLKNHTLLEHSISKIAACVIIFEL